MCSFEAFAFTKFCDVETQIESHSVSLEVTLFDRSYITCLFIILVLSCTNFMTFDFENTAILKFGAGITQCAI